MPLGEDWSKSGVHIRVSSVTDQSATPTPFPTLQLHETVHPRRNTHSYVYDIKIRLKWKEGIYIVYADTK